MSRTEKLISFLLSIFLFINPFLIIRGIQNPYEFPKFIFAVIIAQILAILLFLNKQNLKFDLITKLVFAYLLIVFLANFFGLDPRISLIGSVWRHQGFLLLLSGFILYLAAKSLKNVTILEKSIVISAVILIVTTIIQFISLQMGAYSPTYNGRIVGTMGNPNFLGAYIVIILPFLLFHKFEKPYFKPLFTFLSIISVLITQSRSATIALIIILIIYIVNKLSLGKKIKYLLFFISIPFILLTLYQSSFQRLSIWDNRSLIWDEGVKAAINKPILGYGQENFELIFPKHLNFKVDNAHNLFLETVISSGVLGLILLLSILIVGFKKAEFKYKLFLLAFLAVSFFNPLFISGIILFWIMLGISNNKEVNNF